MSGSVQERIKLSLQLIFPEERVGDFLRSLETSWPNARLRTPEDVMRLVGAVGDAGEKEHLASFVRKSDLINALFPSSHTHVDTTSVINTRQLIVEVCTEFSTLGSSVTSAIAPQVPAPAAVEKVDKPAKLTLRRIRS